VKVPTVDRRALGHDQLEELVPAAVAAIVLAFLLFWIGDSGGYGDTVWYPSALGMIAVWAFTVSWRRSILPSEPAARVALLAFAALVGFNYLSILWAGSQGSALDASNQLLLYLLGGWVLAVLPWTPERLATFVGLWSVGVCVLCADALGRAASASSLTSFFVDGRFATPMAYSNATGAIAVMGGWPALILASRRELPAVLRAGFLGIGTFLATFALLPQSRAALLGMILTAPLVLIVISNRGRALVRLLIVGGAIAYCLPRTVDVNDAVDAGRNVTPVLRHAATTMLTTAILAAVLGLVVSLLEDRLSRSTASPVVDARALLARIARPVGITVAAVTAVVVVVGLVVAWPHITHLVHETVNKGNTDASAGSNRFLSTSPEERFDYDRVALHIFSKNPIVGVGNGNFGRQYDGLRRFVKHSQYTHDLPLRVLSETGLIGIILFVTVVVALVFGMIRVARSRDDLGRACVAIAFAVSGYFLVHSCLDWVDQFPALALPAVGLPLAAITLRAGAGVVAAPAGGGEELSTQAAPTAAGSRSALKVAGLAALVLATLVAAVAVATPYLSLVSINRAFSVFRANPQQAYRDLEVARKLDPLSVNPLTSEGTIALYAGDLDRAQTWFERSVRKEDDWYPRLELALIAAHQGRFAAAHRQLAAAARLDVDDPLIADARSLINRRRRINPYSFNAKLEREGNSSATTQQIIR
jgi:O-Antigen ligase